MAVVSLHDRYPRLFLLALPHGEFPAVPPALFLGKLFLSLSCFAFPSVLITRHNFSCFPPIKLISGNFTRALIPLPFHIPHFWFSQPHPPRHFTIQFIFCLIFTGCLLVLRLLSRVCNMSPLPWHRITLSHNCISHFS